MEQHKEHQSHNKEHLQHQEEEQATLVVLEGESTEEEPPSSCPRSAEEKRNAGVKQTEKRQVSTCHISPAPTKRHRRCIILEEDEESLSEDEGEQVEQEEEEDGADNGRDQQDHRLSSELAPEQSSLNIQRSKGRGVPHLTKWEIMFARLVAFNKKHGHCLVPNRYKEDSKLGSWVSTQRRQYKARNSGRFTTTTLSDDRIERLASIGFEWSTSDPRHVEWNVRFRQLCGFHQEHGHTMVPMGYEANLSLANWVSVQRQEYKSLHQHKSSKLTDERIRLLESVGFTWKAPRGARRKHPMGGESAATLTVCSPIAQSSSSLSKEMPQRMEATSCSISSVRRNPSHLLDETCKAAHNDSTFSNPDREQRRKTHSNSTPNTADVGGTELDRQLLTTIPLRIAYHSPRHRWHPSVLATRSATTSSTSTGTYSSVLLPPQRAQSNVLSPHRLAYMSTLQTSLLRYGSNAAFGIPTLPTPSLAQLPGLPLLSPYFYPSSFTTPSNTTLLTCYPRIATAGPTLGELLQLPNNTSGTSSDAILSSFTRSSLALEESRRRMHLLQTQMESQSADEARGRTRTARRID